MHRHRSGLHARAPVPYHTAEARSVFDADVAGDEGVERRWVDRAECAADESGCAGKEHDDCNQADCVAVDICDDGDSLHGALLRI